MRSGVPRSQMRENLAGLAEADRGEFGSTAEVQAMFDKSIDPLDRAPHPAPHRPPGSQGSSGPTVGAGASTATPNVGPSSAARCRKR
jgi:hypothetical protein